MKRTERFLFPIIVFTDSDEMIALDYPFLMGDKRLLDSAFKNVKIIDSNGTYYKVEKVEQDSGIILKYSIKLMGLIVKVKPIFSQEPEQISFEELKSQIKAHVSKNKRFWLPLDDGRGLNKMIDDTTTFEELIKMFI